MNYNRVPFMQTVHNSLEPWHKLYTNCTREHVHKLALKPVHKLYTLTCTKTVNWDPYTNCTLGVPSVHRNLYTNCTTELVHKLHHLNLTYTHHHVFCTMYCKKNIDIVYLKNSCFHFDILYVCMLYAVKNWNTWLNWNIG